jgi:hypothetical protein
MPDEVAELFEDDDEAEAAQVKRRRRAPAADDRPGRCIRWTTSWLTVLRPDGMGSTQSANQTRGRQHNPHEQCTHAGKQNYLIEN